MAAPQQDGFGGEDYPQPDPYAQQPISPGHAGYTNSPGSPPVGSEQHEAGRKKKRGYAAQAYDFGAGANSALGGQPQAGGAFPPAAIPAYGVYGQPEPQQPYGAPQYGSPVGGPAVGAQAQGYGAQPQYGGGVGYQAPDAAYPGPGAPGPGVAGITQGMGQMGFSGQPGQPQMAAAQPGQPQGGVRPAVLNQLYPTDLLNQPFNVAELELPPPPIILPPSVSYLPKTPKV